MAVRSHPSEKECRNDFLLPVLPSRVFCPCIRQGGQLLPSPATRGQWLPEPGPSQEGNKSCLQAKHRIKAKPSPISIWPHAQGQ